MTWLRSHWLQLLAVVALVAVVRTSMGWANAMGAAATYAERVRVKDDSIATLNEVLVRQRAAVTTSRQREREATERAEAAAADLVAVRARLTVVGDSLDREARAQADSSDGWIRIEVYDAAMAAKDEQLAAADSATRVWHGRFDDLTTHVETVLDPYIGTLELQVANLEERARLDDLEKQALRRAAAPGFVRRILESPVTHLLAAGVGFAGGVAAS